MMTSINSYVFSVDAFGATGDGKNLDTTAVQKAIDCCHEQGGGMVYFTPGKRYKIGTIFLKSNVTIHVENGCEILGSNNLKNYSRDTGICPYYPEALDPCLIYAKGAENIGFSGRGKINGGQRDFPFIRAKEATGRESRQRPMLIRLEECTNIKMFDLTLLGAYSWCTHFKKCENVRLSNLNVFNDIQDGFNIESSKEVIISDCNLKCGDDGIALTTSDRNVPLKDILVSNCIISSRWAAVRFGPLSKGNYENVIIKGCVFKKCNGGGIKLGMYEGGEIKNCIFTDIVMEDVTSPISMFLGRWKDIGNIKGTEELMPLGKISNIQFHNIRAIAKAGPMYPWLDENVSEEEQEDILNRPDRNATLFFHGHKDGKIEKISLHNINITFPGGGTRAQAEREKIVDMHEIDISKGGYWIDNKNTWGVAPAYGLYARHIQGLKMDNVFFETIEKDERPIYFFKECVDIEVGSN